MRPESVARPAPLSGPDRTEESPRSADSDFGCPPLPAGAACVRVGPVAAAGAKGSSSSPPAPVWRPGVLDQALADLGAQGPSLLWIFMDRGLEALSAVAQLLPDLDPSLRVPAARDLEARWERSRSPAGRQVRRAAGARNWEVASVRSVARWAGGGTPGETPSRHQGSVREDGQVFEDGGRGARGRRARETRERSERSCLRPSPAADRRGGPANHPQTGFAGRCGQLLEDHAPGHAHEDSGQENP